MKGSNESITQKINNILIDFNNNVLKNFENEAGNIFSLEQGICPLKSENGFPNFRLTFNEKEKKEIKESIIQKLKWIFTTYNKSLDYLNNLSVKLTTNIKVKDPFYYGVLNKISEYISKLNNIVFDCQRIDKHYKLNTSNKLKEIKNYTYKENSLEFKYLSSISINFSIHLMGLGKNNEEKFYDSNIDIKELKKKCGKTLSNDYNTISNGYTMRSRSFEINNQLREGGIKSLNDSDIKVITALIKTCSINPCYKNMILYRFVDQNFIKNLFGLEFSNYSESSVSDTVNKLLDLWRKGSLIKVEGGFISSSYLYSKNVFQNRDILLKLYVPQGTPIYATDNDEESEVIISCGLSYVFFEAYYEKISKLKEDFYRLVMKAFIKAPSVPVLEYLQSKNLPPVLCIGVNNP